MTKIRRYFKAFKYHMIEITSQGTSFISRTFDSMQFRSFNGEVLPLRARPKKPRRQRDGQKLNTGSNMLQQTTAVPLSRLSRMMFSRWYFFTSRILVCGVVSIEFVLSYYLFLAYRLVDL